MMTMIRSIAMWSSISLLPNELLFLIFEELDFDAMMRGESMRHQHQERMRQKQQRQRSRDRKGQRERTPAQDQDQEPEQREQQLVSQGEDQHQEGDATADQVAAKHKKCLVM